MSGDEMTDRLRTHRNWLCLAIAAPIAVALAGCGTLKLSSIRLGPSTAPPELVHRTPLPRPVAAECGTLASGRLGDGSSAH